MHLYLYMSREALLSYIRNGNDVQALGSLSVLATLLQTKGCFTIFMISLSSLHFVSL